MTMRSVATIRVVHMVASLVNFMKSLLLFNEIMSSSIRFCF